MISKIIQPGIKADLCLVQNIEEQRKTGVRAHIYKSQVTDLFEGDEFELSMPTEDGKLVMLPIGMRLELVFYGADCLYRGIGMISERYKTNNRYMLRISLKSPIHKFRRHEYYRIPCAIQMVFYDITMEQAVELEKEQYQTLVKMSRTGLTRKEGFAADISGDGVQFVSDTEIQEDSYIMMQFQLRDGKDSKIYLLPAHILSSSPSEDGEEHFVCRAEFIIKDRSVREDIIRYIFDEERKNRNRERSPDTL